MIEQCKKEVIELHNFFENWHLAQIENTEENFQRLQEVVAPDFMLITPDGDKNTRDEVINRIRNDYGKYSNEDSRYRLFIKNIKGKLIEKNACLILYEEWANIGDRVTSRMSSAIFRRNDDAPNGVIWTHVHETFFPNTV